MRTTGEEVLDAKAFLASSEAVSVCAPTGRISVAVAVPELLTSAVAINFGVAEASMKSTTPCVTGFDEPVSTVAVSVSAVSAGTLPLDESLSAVVVVTEGVRTTTLLCFAVLVVKPEVVAVMDCVPTVLNVTVKGAYPLSALEKVWVDGEITAEVSEVVSVAVPVNAGVGLPY